MSKALKKSFLSNTLKIKGFEQSEISNCEKSIIQDFNKDPYARCSEDSIIKVRVAIVNTINNLSDNLNLKIPDLKFALSYLKDLQLIFQTTCLNFATIFFDEFGDFTMDQCDEYDNMYKFYDKKLNDVILTISDCLSKCMITQI